MVRLSWRVSSIDEVGGTLEQQVDLQPEELVDRLVGLAALELGVAALEHDGELPAGEHVVPADRSRVAPGRVARTARRARRGQGGARRRTSGPSPCRGASCPRVRGGRSAPTRGRPADRRSRPSPSRRRRAAAAAARARTARCRACSRRGTARAGWSGGRCASSHSATWCAAGRSRPPYESSCASQRVSWRGEVVVRCGRGRRARTPASRPRGSRRARRPALRAPARASPVRPAHAAGTRLQDRADRRCAPSRRTARRTPRRRRTRRSGRAIGTGSSLIASRMRNSRSTSCAVAELAWRGARRSTHRDAPRSTANTSHDPPPVIGVTVMSHPVAERVVEEPLQRFRVHRCTSTPTISSTSPSDVMTESGRMSP